MYKISLFFQFNINWLWKLYHRIPRFLRPGVWIEAIDNVFFKKWTTVKNRWQDSTYTDICELLPYTVMELVCRYVEREMDRVDWTWCEEVRADSTIIMAAYRFWYDEYLPFKEDQHPHNQALYEEVVRLDPGIRKMVDPDTGIYDSSPYPEYEAASRAWMEFEINIEKQLDEHLAKLMSVRQRLWT